MGIAMDKYQVNANNFRILGRTIESAGIRWLAYSASGIEFITSASVVKADIAGITGTGDDSDYAWIGIILNDDQQKMKRVRIARGMRTYTICENFGLRDVKITILKLTEEKDDKVGIAAVYADCPVLPEKTPDRRILFIGDSITAGYGVEAGEAPGDTSYVYDSADTNPLRAYPYLTARGLSADFQLFCWSGNGVISHWIENTDLPDTADLMPALYPYTAKNTEEVVRITMSAKGVRGVSFDPNAPAGSPRGLTIYDPAEFVPDVIVSNLGTNDASYTKGTPARERLFMQRYAQFLAALGRDYPGALKIAAYGLMEQSLAPAVREAAFLSDSLYLPLPMLDPADGLGGGQHPGALTHTRTAKILIQAIRQQTGWPQQTAR